MQALLMTLWHGLTNKRYRSFSVVGASFAQVVLCSMPGLSAEHVYINYGPFERSVSIEDLEHVASTGELPTELLRYSRHLSAERLTQLSEGLVWSADLDVVSVAQLLYTPQGEAILEDLGNIIQTAGRQNGASAIRGAMILAAADPDGGLNVINFLKYFATKGLRVDYRHLSTLVETAISMIHQTHQAVEQLHREAYQTAIFQNDGNFQDSRLFLSAEGEHTWEVQIFDETVLPTHLYLPERANKTPLIVISHGLGGQHSTFSYLAKHLASHGFAVAVVKHPGSSNEQIRLLLSGRADEAVQPEDMVQRPMDIQTLLNELETSVQHSLALKDRIDFDRVGVLGQSMGGYTSLALAGATVDINTLESSCPPEVIADLNISLLLQCLVLSLPQPLPSLQDNRVKAAFAINPFSSAIFGPDGMANVDVPTMIVSGSNDAITPAINEQILPFTWLSASERYLMMMEDDTHFSTIFDPQAVEESIPIPDRAIGPNPALSQHYVKTMSLAFFKTHLAQDSTYRKYLTPSYVAAISQPDIPIALATEFKLDE